MAAYPLITTVSCFTGQYDGKEDPSIVESMIRQPKRGSVAVVAPIRTGKPHFHQRSDFRLMVSEGKLDGTTQPMEHPTCFIALDDCATYAELGISGTVLRRTYWSAARTDAADDLVSEPEVGSELPDEETEGVCCPACREGRMRVVGRTRRPSIPEFLKLPWPWDSP